MLVIYQIQTGLRLYCAWIAETIVPGCIGYDRQPRFEIVLIGNQNLSYLTFSSEDRQTLISGSPVEAEPTILNKTLMDISRQPN